MVAGDVVSGLSIAAVLDFQPAAGVECVITMCCANTTVGVGATLYDGVTQSYVLYAVASGMAGYPNMKFFVTNTRWLRLGDAAVNNAFTGIQTK